MTVRFVTVAVALVAFAGCGQEEASTKTVVEGCKEVTADYRICGLPTEEEMSPRPHIDRRDGDGWRELAGPRGSQRGGHWQGHWRSLQVAPDGETLLATWSAECEVPAAYFVPAQGGELRPVAAGAQSVGLGWADDGRARVELLGKGCGHAAVKPGIYLFDPKTGKRKFVEGPLKGPMPLTSS